MKNDAAVTGIAEHKLKKGQAGQWKDYFKQAKKKLACGPSDYTKKVPQAGVAIAAGERVKMDEAEIKTEAFKKCYEQGRVLKVYIECGWTECVVCYETYCEAGGTNRAKEHNVEIMEAIRGEMVGEETLPTLIMGDFNATPVDNSTIKAMIEDDAWIDIGHCAEWRDRKAHV